MLSFIEFDVKRSRTRHSAQVTIPWAPTGQSSYGLKLIAACSGSLPIQPALATIDIYCHFGVLQPTGRFQQRSLTLSSSLNVQLTDALRKYVDERASDKDVYATPSEYIRDLIRQDMQDRAVALNILEGLGDLRNGRFSDKSILDFKDED
jgi:antitoxin ParD1/3/4